MAANPLKPVRLLIFSCLALITILTSCGKKSPAGLPDLKPGRYEYVSVTGYNFSSIENLHNLPNIRYVSKVNWKTENIGGELVVDKNFISTSGLSFVVDTTAMDETFTNGTLTATGKSTYSMSVDPYNSSHKFTFAGGDSIKFAGGTTLFDGAISTNEPIMLKIRIEEEYLIISSDYSKRELSSNDIGSWERIISFSLVAKLRKKS